MTNQVLTKLVEERDLTVVESRKLLQGLLDQEFSPSQVGAILTALRMKGETPQELLGFIEVMRKHATHVHSTGVVIDTCGTGGDGNGTFNISTAVALVVAACGVKVAKHGNRAVSSQCGSADVLETLGVNINLNQLQASDMLEKVGLVFLFAPLFHPTMKVVAPIRHELKIRTIFNNLGPFVNPANVKRQLIGVPNVTIAHKLAEVAAHLAYEHVMIVTSGEGIDEISVSDKTHIFEVKGKQIKRGIVDAAIYGVKRSSISALRGGDAAENALIITSILNGKTGPKRDVVVINSAAALYVAGKVKDIAEGVTLAKQVIDSGKAVSLLQTFISVSRSYL